jgi:hypothetical protein
MSPRVAAAITAVLIVLAAAAGLYWKGWREGAAHERPKTQAALGRAAVAGLEGEGARASAQRVDVVIRQREAAARAVAELSAHALQSEDANAPLSADRARRLHDADRQLCLTSPDLAGCAQDRDAR